MNIGVVPLASSIVIFLFALAVFDQFFVRRKPCQLLGIITIFVGFLGGRGVFGVCRFLLIRGSGRAAGN